MFAKNTNFDLKIPTLKIGELINKLNINTNKKDKSFTPITLTEIFITTSNTHD